MAFRYSATAAILLLVSGVALADTDKPATGCGNAAATSARGGSASAGSSASGGPVSREATRTRSEVHAEAVEAARQDRPTLARELDFLKN
ncbi:MAG: hypothetical protein ABIT83_19730 [Massilia sp.]